MNAGQRQFFDFIMERTRDDQKNAMKALLEEGFARQDNGTFTSEYMADYTPKMLSFLMPEHVEEVKAITENFGKHRAQA
jgi:hypothetical protein